MALTFRQVKGVVSGAGVTSVGLAYTSVLTSGSYLVAFVLGLGTLSVTDPTNGTWEQLGTTQNNKGIFHVPSNTSTAALTVTAHCTSATTLALMIGEYTGQAASQPFDQVAQLVDSTNAVGPVLMDATNETLIAIGWLNNVVTNTAGTGFTLRAPFGNPTNALWEDGPFSGFGTQSATWSLGGGGSKFLISVKSTTSVYQGATFSPASGTKFTGTQTVTISSAAPSPTIYYTIDGTTPTTSSPTVANGGSIAVTSSCIVQAIVVSGGVTSSVSSATYTQNFNQVWVDQGVVIAPVSSDSPGQPCVRYDPNPQILAANPDGNVFKIWFRNHTTQGNICYAESNDGKAWTRYVSNPVIAGQEYPGRNIPLVNGVYYLYTQTQPYPGNGINVYTSTDGINWTLRKSQAITKQAWMTGQPTQLAVVTIDSGGTWWAYYTDSTTFVSGLVSSADGINWTQLSPNGPVSDLVIDCASFHQINGSFYGWNGGCPTNPPTFAYCNGSRWRSSGGPTGTWSKQLVSAIYPTLLTDTIDGTHSGCQYGDSCTVEALGNSYYYYSVNPGDQNDGLHFQIGVAIATGKTLAQIVGTYEGIPNIPIPTPVTLNLASLANDNFQRADGSLGPNWRTNFPLSGYGPGAILSNAATAAAGAATISSWQNIAFPSDQWVQVTIGPSINNSFVGAALRIQSPNNTSPPVSCYDFLFHGNTGSAGTVLIRKVTNGGLLFTTLRSITTTIKVGDVFTCCAIGSNLILYWNNCFLTLVQDSTYSTGAVGIEITNGTNPGDASITNFQAGVFTDAPAFPSGSGGGWMQPQRDLVRKHGLR